MKTLIIILIIASFVQTTVWPFDLVLIILICRSYIRISKSNLYLAFIFGILVSFLSLTTIGFYSLIYLFAVSGTQVLSQHRLARNSLAVVPITFLMMCFSRIVTSIFMHKSVDLFPNVLIESIISLFIFYALRLWEERFIVRADIRLKV